MKLSKTHLTKIIQSDGFLGQLLVPLMKLGLPLMKNVLMLLAKSVLVLLGLTAAASATGAGIYKKISRSGTSGWGTTTLIISDEEIKSGLLIKSLIQTTENETQVQRGGFLVMISGTLGASLLGNVLVG